MLHKTVLKWFKHWKKRKKLERNQYKENKSLTILSYKMINISKFLLYKDSKISALFQKSVLWGNITILILYCRIAQAECLVFERSVTWRTWLVMLNQWVMCHVTCERLTAGIRGGDCKPPGLVWVMERLVGIEERRTYQGGRGHS